MARWCIPAIPAPSVSRAPFVLVPGSFSTASDSCVALKSMLILTGAPRACRRALVTDSRMIR
jgi:hypothetical protein